MSNILNLKGVRLFAIIVLAMAILATFGMVAVQQAEAAYMHTVTLRQGSTGPQVASLQMTLGGLTADGNFGPLTRAAVVAFQTSNNLVADGVVCPMTGAALAGVVAGGGSVPLCPNGNTLASNCTTSPAGPSGPTCPNGNLIANNCMPSGGGPGPGLSGGAGDITVTSLSTYSGESIKAGEKDVKVLGFEIEADDGSDVRITSVKIELKQTDTDSSQRITDYADEVSIWMGSTKVGSDDTSDFSESSDIYTKSVSLSNAVIRA